MNKKYLKDDKDLMKEYDVLKNTNIDLDNITLGSNKKIWWKCSQEHEWAAFIYNRNKGTGCPICKKK